MLEIVDTPTLAVIVVCRGCTHTRPIEEALYIWIDSNGDVYYQGTVKESLAAFIFHHG
jgi:hypothetical protein